MLTPVKPGYEGRVSIKRTPIPANPTGTSFYSKVNYSVYKAVSRHLILNGNANWKSYHLLENFKIAILFLAFAGGREWLKQKLINSVATVY